MRHPDIAFKAEIFSTIADSVYSNTHFKIREAVSNACDNKAEIFILTIDKEKKMISLFNDGEGISDSHFEEIVKSFGRGLYRDKADPEKYFSHFGVGLLSVFKLGEKVSIFSRTSPRKMNLFEIDSEELFSEETGKKNVSDLNEYFEIIEEKTKKIAEIRDDLSPLDLEDAYDKSEAAEKHFAEFVIEGVDKGELDLLLKESDELREILPLKPDKKDPELLKLRASDKKNILKILNNSDFCPTIKFFCSDNGEDYEIWYKYFPELDISKNCKVFTGKNNDFAYYAIAAGKNLGDRHSLSLRSKNVLIKTNTVIEQTGPNQVLDSSIKMRVYGEILHKNMKQFIEVTRNEFIKNKKFKEFRDDVLKFFEAINKDLRTSYKKGLEVLNYVHSPFESIRKEKKDNPLKNIEKKVEKLADSDKSQEIIECAQELLNEMKDPELESAEDVSSILSKQEQIDFKGEDYILRISSDIDEAKSEWDPRKNTTIVNVPASTFDTMYTTWFGHPFTIRFVYVDEEAGPYSVDFDNKTLTINTFYQDFQKYGLSFLEVVMALELSLKRLISNDLECRPANIGNCLKLYKDKIIDMLTADYQEDKEKKLGIIKQNITEALR